VIEIGLGVLLWALGALMLWLSTAGSGWNSTHDRFGHPTPQVSHGQTLYNDWAGRVIALIAFVAGVALIVAAAR
jgi:hypothetical protein